MKLLPIQTLMSRMPPPPRSRLTAEQIGLIQKNGSYRVPKTSAAKVVIPESVGFIADIEPIFKTSCQSCHSGNSPSGGQSLVRLC
ncbi:MAG: hypothetical protein U5L96_04350 [Owenweeksia sp.]|nr:hypothetical protein [Owenweeksia sp.]